MKKIRLSLILMLLTVLLLALFEGYWLNKLYHDEHISLKKELDINFRDVMYQLQQKRFETDSSLVSQNFTASIPVSVNNKNLSKAKIDSNKKATIVLRSFSNEDDLSNINPEMIQSINVNSGYSFRGIPPPGLIEVMIRKQANANDSSKVILRIDSTMSGDPSLHEPHKKITSSFTFKINGKDSTAFKFQKDSALKMKKDGFASVDTAHHQPITWVVKTNSKQNVNGHLNVGNVVLDMRGKVEENNQSPIVRFLVGNKTINDSIPVKVVDSAFSIALIKSNRRLPFSILFNKYANGNLRKSDFEIDSTNNVITSKIFVGYSTPYSYQAIFSKTNSFVLMKMSNQIGGSLFLLVLVIFSFVTVYRNLLAQRRITLIKNDFISNITHELKTPIATVNVAIEALRNFGGLDNPKRTKEYLDISASELQRLGLLVDKVLKLSMFENHEIVLQYESFNLLTLIEEVMLSMKLQFEKEKVSVQIESVGDNFMIDGDKLHITSVIYNLLDNALKYRKESPRIIITLIRQNNYFELQVSDNGIGIPDAYIGKIFDQFFRVPNSNRHNTKGYGLGLSYVHHIVKQHRGFIEVNSEFGKGSTFIVKVPFSEKGTGHFVQS